jgi:hypothetical protein
MVDHSIVITSSEVDKTVTNSLGTYRAAGTAHGAQLFKLDDPTRTKFLYQNGKGIWTVRSFIS